MARYTYKAYGRDGALATGEISADSRDSALEALAKRGQIPFDLAEAKLAQNVPWWQREVFGTGALSSRHLAMFTQELASLIKAEVPVDEALRIVAVQPMLPARLKQMTNSILERVLEGDALSGAISAQGRAFPDYYSRLIKSGEMSGALGDVLGDLAKVTANTAEARAKAAAALVYPFVLLLAALAAITVILTVLIPALLPIFEDAGVKPPFLIRTLSGVQGFISQHWLLMLAAMALSLIGLMLAWRNPQLRLSLDRLILKLPLAGSLIERRETARFSRTLAVLTRNGVPILDTMRIAGSVLTNRAYSEAVANAGNEIKEGGTLTAPLAKSGLFPDLFLRLTAVGEKTGQLDTMQLRVAEIYEQAVDRQMERMTALITPVLTLVIGGLVGGLIVSVMGAIFSVNDLALK